MARRSPSGRAARPIDGNVDVRSGYRLAVHDVRRSTGDPVAKIQCLGCFDHAPPTYVDQSATSVGQCARGRRVPPPSRRNPPPGGGPPVAAPFPAPRVRRAGFGPTPPLHARAAAVTATLEARSPPARLALLEHRLPPGPLDHASSDISGYRRTERSPSGPGGPAERHPRFGVRVHSPCPRDLREEDTVTGLVTEGTEYLREQVSERQVGPRQVRRPSPAVYLLEEGEGRVIRAQSGPGQTDVERRLPPCPMRRSVTRAEAVSPLATWIRARSPAGADLAHGTSSPRRTRFASSRRPSW